MKIKLFNISRSLKKVLSVVLVIGIFTIMFSQLVVNAGSGTIIIDRTSFEESINSSVWSDPGGDMSVSNGKIVFSKDNYEESRLITVSSISKSSQHECLFKSEMDLILKSIPADKSFAIAYSLSAIEAALGDSESIAVLFSNNGGKISAKAVYYDADGGQKELSSKNISIPFNRNINVKTEVMGSANCTISVNNTVIFKGEAPTEMTGRVGFLQNGVCEAEISNAYIEFYKYDTPENVNISENFETGSFNMNCLASKMSNNNYSSPSGLSVEDYNGSKVLMFKNVGMGWFGTTYQYSNFECTFDIPFVLYSNVTDERSNIIRPATQGFMFTYGDPSDYYDTYGYGTSADALKFDTATISNFKNSKISASIPKLFNYDNNEGYSVKIRVYDTQFSLQVKALNSNDWQDLLSYKIGNETPLGYIHIWSTGSANFGIDNFCVTNLDKDAKLTEVDYKEYHVAGTEDWVYKPMKVIYKDTTSKTSLWLRWPMLLAYSAVISAIGITVAVLIKKKKIFNVKTPLKDGASTESKESEGIQDEE